ncbi:MAG: hypothetical protein JNL67_18505 [Planctomycetaceae bacterium]|nr:hypothetical protein [Planctomycetaceae bacterium]
MSHPPNRPPKIVGYNPYDVTYTRPSGTNGPLGEPHRGNTILVFGILGILLCPIFGLVAWTMAQEDLPKINSGRMDPAGRGTTHAGMICGIISSLLLIFQLAIGLCFLLAIFSGR